MFKSIHAVNLFSWEKLDYEIQNGISQISGWNYDDETSEGSGKSSVANTLCWTLYGKIPKDAKVDEVVREGAKSATGEVLLEGDYRVVRRRNPNQIFIETPLGETKQGKDARETQLMINALVGLDFEAFCQTIYFAQNYPNKFISSSETDKAAILSEVLDLSKFDKARKSVEIKLKAAQADLQKESRIFENANQTIEKIESNMSLLVNFIEKSQKEQTNEINKLTAEIAECETRIANHIPKDVSALESEAEQIQAMLDSLGPQKAELHKEIEGHQKQIDARARLERRISASKTMIDRTLVQLEHLGETSKPGNCPTCKQPASKIVLERHAQHAADQKAELMASLESAHQEQAATLKELAEFPKIFPLDKLKKLMRDIDEEREQLFQIKKKISNQIASAHRESVEIQAMESAIKKAKANLQQIKAKTCKTEMDKLEKLAVEIEDAKQTAAVTETEMRLWREYISKLDILRTGFKEVKQYVFQTLLHELSVKSTKLAADLFTLPISITFSNDSEEGGVSKIQATVALDGCERSLGLYSGGQYRRIELAVDLALASIVANRSQNPINLRILDEPFKDLSETSIEKAVALLERLQGSTIIIEHSPLAKSIIDSEFKVELRGGISRHAS